MTKDRDDNFKEKLKGEKDALKTLDRYTHDQVHSIADYEKMLVKSIMLVNGGAIVALLAFIGNIWSIEVEQSVFTSLITALKFFIYGLLSSILCVVISIFYSIDFTIYAANKERNKQKGEISVRISNYVKMIAMSGSILLFVFGVEHALNAFEKHSSSCRTAPCDDLELGSENVLLRLFLTDTHT